MTSRKSTTELRLADCLSPPSPTSQPAADTETTAKVASPSANDACCDVGSENITTQIQSTTEVLPMAVDDLGTQSAEDGLEVDAVCRDDQALADGQFPYVSS
jgi:hypothetical protein